ncbi:MAG: DUF1003 domain-containing protein [Candidatus Nanoarchaeia archaeon]
MSKKTGVKEQVKNLKEDVPRIIKGERTLGQKAADALARYAGSWGFIICFVIFLIAWMLTNVYAWINTWDPYPFILLNLVLSCLAAIQAPIILMSQNRQAEKDRRKAEYDYQVDKKTQKQVYEIRQQLFKIQKMLRDKD